MNSCYYCGKLVDRAPYDRTRAHVCDACKSKAKARRAKGLNALTGEPEKPEPSLRDYWTALEQKGRAT